MIKRFAIILALALLAAPALAQKVHIDYDMSAPFSTYKTVAWAKTEPTSVADTAPLLHEKIKQAIEAQIQSKNLVGADENPDLYVTYHTNEKEEMALDITRFGYDYASTFHWDPYWNHGPSMGTADTHVSTFGRGTLVIDFWDPKTGKLVWRGTATAVVKENPEKAEKQVQKAIKKIARKWDQMVEKGL